VTYYVGLHRFFTTLQFLRLGVGDFGRWSFQAVRDGKTETLL